jgi:hypothetical protein
MPGFNKTGPHGEGPMSGKKMGHCNPENKGKTDDEILKEKKPSLSTGEGTGHGKGLGRGNGGAGQGLGRQHRFRGGK